MGSIFDITKVMLGGKENKNTFLSIVLVILFYGLSRVMHLSLPSEERVFSSINIVKEDSYSKHTRKQIDILQSQYIDMHNQIKKELKILQKDTVHSFFIKEIKWKKEHFQAIIYMPYHDRRYIHEIWSRHKIKIDKTIHKKNISYLYVEWNLPISSRDV